MSVRTHNVIGLLGKIDHALESADKKHSFENGLNIAKQVIGLLGIGDAPETLKSFPRLKANPSWTKNAPDYEDRKASYTLAENNPHSIDFKLYWSPKPTKRIISNFVALTPNFEDEAFYSNKNIGIDFVIPDKADRLIVVLSNNYKIRTLEIHRHLSNTQKKIFEKWAQEFDFSNKALVHKVLWDSFDIQPLNKEFYLGISELFTDLVQHLEKKNILDKKHRSQFVNRLIGRIIFCWFLRKKEIISEEVGYFETESKPATEYYAKKLEVLFFKVLNTSIDERGFGIDDKTPFLNGGLFEEKESDLAGRGELSFPPDYFDRFYSFLNRYNFTTDESTSDFQQVAIDPEMLGRIFENLLAEEIEETGEQARKAKGAFYTPREIVDYMCRESLRAYVSEKLGEDARKGEVLQLLFDKREHELDPKSVLGKLGSYKNRIIDALDEIKIIDPACGSGAFPIGMLQIMLTIYERLDARLDHYKTKLTIIKNNIFGVDIEPMAVEISRLRTWLSLVVDSVIKPSEKNKGIEELPNLDFKFICANSLVPLEEEGGLFDNKQMAEQMQTIRERYFKTNSQRIKDKMKRDFEDLLKRNQSMFASAKQKQLLTYHPFDSDNVCAFFDPQFIFGLPNFDTAIANPPYVRVDKLQNSSLYKKMYSTAIGKYDLYYLFFERAFSLISDKGVCVFITPNKFCAADSAAKLREIYLGFMTNGEILSTSKLGVFESASNYPVISVLRRNSEKNDYLEVLEAKDIEKLSVRNEFSGYRLRKSDYNLLPGRVIPINTNQVSINIISRLFKDSIPLNSILSISEGLRIPAALESSEPSSIKIVKQYQFTKYSSIKIGSFIDNAIISNVISKQSQRYKKIVQDKIVIAEDSLEITATLDCEKMIPQGGVYFAVLTADNLDIRFLLGLLNSKLFSYIYKILYSGMHMGGGYLRYRSKFLEFLPLSKQILEFKMKDQRVVIDLVENILNISAKQDESQEFILAKNSDAFKFAQKIDEEIVNIYRLTKEEREIIFSS